MTPPTSAGYAAAQADLLRRADAIHLQAQLDAVTAAHRDLHDRRVLSMGVVWLLVALAALGGVAAGVTVHDRADVTLQAFASAGGAR